MIKKNLSLEKKKLKQENNTKKDKIFSMVNFKKIN